MSPVGSRGVEFATRARREGTFAVISIKTYGATYIEEERTKDVEHHHRCWLHTCGRQVYDAHFLLRQFIILHYLVFAEAEEEP